MISVIDRPCKTKRGRALKWAYYDLACNDFTLEETLRAYEYWLGKRTIKTLYKKMCKVL